VVLAASDGNGDGDGISSGLLVVARERIMPRTMEVPSIPGYDQDLR
jgi:hypothetical protein